MKLIAAVTSLLLAILMAGTSVTNAKVLSIPSTTYSCGFDSSGYTAPGTNQSVNVGGVFTLTINGGSVANSTATLSVDDGGDGPAVCQYSSGNGSIEDGSPSPSFNLATLEYQAANDNSPLCPPGDASLAFMPVSNGLKFIYTNSAGFVGNGNCEVAGTPPPVPYACSYTVKNSTGTAAGQSLIVINPPFSEQSAKRTALAFGVEAYPNLPCPFLGSGPVTYPSGGQPNQGSWQLTLANPLSGCPKSPLESVNFTTGASAIFITAPGISQSSCVEGKFVGALRVDQTLLKFGVLKVGKSAVKTVKATNIGLGDLVITGVAIAGAADFTQTNNCGVLAPEASCSINVTFAPAKKGTKNGDLQISSTTPPVTHVDLVGTGQ